MKPDDSFLRRHGRAVALALLVLLLVAGAVWLYGVMSKPTEPTKKRTVQEISLLKPPPPPPPPKTPPPPPPPEQKQEKIDVPKQDAPPPDQPSEAPPPGQDLGVDAAGSGGGDNFGLVGKPGGGDLIGSGGGGGGGNRFAWYGALVKDRITEAVQRDKKLREAAEYQRVVHVWVSSGGQVTKVEFVGPSDKPELDEALRLALRNLPAVREGAPGDMPQPIRLRISTRS